MNPEKLLEKILSPENVDELSSKSKATRAQQGWTECSQLK